LHFEAEEAIIVEVNQALKNGRCGSIFRKENPMHARVVFSHLRPGKTNEDVELFQESVLPLTRQQQGFKGVLYLTDASNDKGLMITLWEGDAHVKASAGGSYQQQLAAHVPRLARSPLIEVYQVHIQE
jgi:quinol monooxygenase YgiN